MEPVVAQHLEPGTFVLSLRGRDAGNIFVVVETDTSLPGFCGIADGKIHRLESVKWKNGKHLLQLRVEPYSQLHNGSMTNRNLRQAIAGILDACINDIERIGV